MGIEHLSLLQKGIWSLNEVMNVKCFASFKKLSKRDVIIFIALIVYVLGEPWS